MEVSFQTNNSIEKSFEIDFFYHWYNTYQYLYCTVIGQEQCYDLFSEPVTYLLMRVTNRYNFAVSKNSLLIFSRLNFIYQFSIFAFETETFICWRYLPEFKLPRSWSHWVLSVIRNNGITNLLYTRTKIILKSLCWIQQVENE